MMNLVGHKAYSILVLLVLTACQSSMLPSTQQSSHPTNTPSPTLTLTPHIETQAVMPTLKPSPSPSPTQIPTYQPAQLLTAATSGLNRILTTAAGRNLVCLRYEDLDADGIPEWIALTHQEDTAPNLQAYVLDENNVYTLEPAQPKPGVTDVGLGQFPVCEIDIQDINLDGHTDIAIFGHTQSNETLLNLFSWDPNKEKYVRLGYFSGDAGVQLVESDGDLALEIWEGYRVLEAPTLTWIIIHTWQDQTYGWTSDRFDWYFQERPHTYPSHGPEFAVISYYLALNDRDLPGAYALLLPQGRDNYESWAIGYATTIHIDVGNAQIIPASITPGRARVSAMVTSYDNEGGIIIRRLWNVEWDTAETEQGWRLLASTADMLEETKATYFP